MSGLQGAARSPGAGSTEGHKLPHLVAAGAPSSLGDMLFSWGRMPRAPLPLLGAWGGCFRFSGQCDSVESEGFGAGQTQGSGQLCW